MESINRTKESTNTERCSLKHNRFPGVLFFWSCAHPPRSPVSAWFELLAITDWRAAELLKPAVTQAYLNRDLPSQTEQSVESHHFGRKCQLRRLNICERKCHRPTTQQWNLTTHRRSGVLTKRRTWSAVVTLFMFLCSVIIQSNIYNGLNLVENIKAKANVRLTVWWQDLTYDLSVQFTYSEIQCSTVIFFYSYSIVLVESI